MGFIWNSVRVFSNLLTIPAVQESPCLLLSLASSPIHSMCCKVSHAGEGCVCSHISVSQCQLCHYFCATCSYSFQCYVSCAKLNTGTDRCLKSKFCLLMLWWIQFFHFHDFISQENSNYVTLVKTDANNTEFTTALLSPQGLLSMGGWKVSQNQTSNPDLLF